MFSRAFSFIDYDAYSGNLTFHACVFQSTRQPDSSPQALGVAYRTKHPGNAAIALRDDGKVCAVGGWDGK